MGDQHLVDIVSNVRAIGAILERISVQSAGSTPLNDVTPESLVRQAANQQDKHSSWETVTTFITRLSALEKEIEASGSGRPVSRAGENSLERLRKGIHRAATSLGLAGRQEVVLGPQSPLVSRQSSRHTDHGLGDDMVPAGFESIEINAALLATSVGAQSGGGHVRSSSWFGWSKSPNVHNDHKPGRPPLPRLGRSRSAADMTASLLQKEKQPGRSMSRAERTSGSPGLLRRLACCGVQRGGSQVSSVNYKPEPTPDPSEKLGSLLLSKLQYWDKELARLRDQALNCGAFVRHSHLTELCAGSPLFISTPPTYVRLHRLADLMLQALRSGPEKLVLLHGMSGMGKSLLALDIAHDLDKGLDYPSGVYFLQFGERFGEHCNEAELQAKILEQQKLLISQMGYAGEKVSETPGVSVADTTQLLATKLSGKRSLLILDEVWSPKIVEHFLIAGHKGKLLVTSGCGASGRFFSDEDIKKQCVGSHGASSCVLFHVGLDDYRSKQMDQRILKSISLTKIDAQVKDFATRILDACGGCPLALSIAGHMLRCKEHDEWERLSGALLAMRADVTTRSSGSQETFASTQPGGSFHSAALTLKDEDNVALEGTVTVHHVRQSTISEPSLQSFDVNSYTTASSHLKDDIKFAAFLSMHSNCSDFFFNNLDLQTYNTAGSLPMESSHVADSMGIPESNSSEFWILEPNPVPAAEEVYSTVVGLIELCSKKLSAEQLVAFKAMSLFQDGTLIPATVVELAIEVMHEGTPCSDFVPVMDGLVKSGLLYQSLDKRFYWTHSTISRYLSRHHAEIRKTIVEVHQLRLSLDTTGQETGQLSVSSVGDKARLLYAFLLTYAHPDLKQTAVNQLGLKATVLGGVKRDIQELALSMIRETDNRKMEVGEHVRLADVVLAATLRHSGNLRTSLGDLEGALDELNRAHRLEPDDVLTLQMRGAILVHYEDYDSAMADVDQADKLMPDDSFTLQIRGNIKRCVDKNEEALQDLERANELDPNKSFTLSVLGAVKLNLGDYHGALMDLDRAALLEPNDQFILTVRGNTKLHLEDYQGALEDLDKALDKTLDRQFSTKSISNAVLDKRTVGVEDPNRSFALSVRGAVKLSLGDLQGALADLDEANCVFPNDSFTLKLRATVKLQSRDYRGSLSDLDECCLLDPDDTDILRLRGNVKRYLGDFQGALEDFTRSNFLEPYNSFTLKFRGNVKRCLTDYKGALEDLDQADKLRPDSNFTSLIRANVRGILGDHKGALEDLNRVLQSETACAFGLLERGIAKYLTGDLEGALLDLDAAHGVQPESADILKYRGNVRFLLQDYAGAEADRIAADTVNSLSVTPHFTHAADDCDRQIRELPTAVQPG